MIQKRYLFPFISQDLQKKMVFLGGPRQVGKTTLAKNIGANVYKNPQYLNWDRRQDQRLIRDETFDANADLIIFDEVHKYRQWKNYIKGIFDTQQERFDILVTGSARLDLYQRGGDSLMGRYHYYRLHPFSVAELSGHVFSGEVMQSLSFPASVDASICDRLFESGGFPEPLFANDARSLRRWQNERLDRLVREDIRDVELIRDLSSLQVLTELLPNTVSSRLSLNALREDLSVAHKTVALWVDVLERFYFHFRLYPFAERSIRSLKKEPKLYVWDWAQLTAEAARFENMIASHLLKFVHFLHDVHGYHAELHYIRDIQGHEVDFLVSIDKKPWFAVEAKYQDAAPAKHLRYFGKKMDIPFLFQVIRTPGIDRIAHGVRVMSAELFLAGLI